MTSKARYQKDGSRSSPARFRAWAIGAFALAVSGCGSAAARVHEAPCGFGVVREPTYSFAVPVTWNAKHDQTSASVESPYVGVRLRVEPSRDELDVLRARYVDESKRGHSYVDSAARTVSGGAAFLIETRFVLDGGAEMHHLSLFTAAGGKLFTFVCGAHERDWGYLGAICSDVVDSFTVTR